MRRYRDNERVGLRVLASSEGSAVSAWGPRAIMKGRRRITCPLWGAGIAVWLIAGPAAAQQGSLLPEPWLPPASEACVVNAAVQPPPPAGDPAKDDQEKKGDPQSGTSNNRLFGALPDFLTVENAHLPPLTTKQKFDVTIRST